jgi:hypothetical protein
MNFTKGLLLLAALFVATLTFGTIGFLQHDHFLTAVYKAIQLFSLESGAVAEPVPISLEIGRWLGLLTTLTGFVGAAAAAFHGFRAALGVKLSKGHDIVCGAGEKGCAVAESLLSSGTKVAMVEIDTSLPSVSHLQKRGALVVFGDARDAAILRKAGLRKASHLVCATGDDNTNLAIAMAAASDADAMKDLKVHVHVGDVAHSDILLRNGILGGNSGAGVYLSSFNFFRNRARCILRDFPLECGNDGNVRESIKLVLPRLDRLGAALVLQSALVGHFRSGGKVDVHVVGPDASRQVQQLLNHAPNFDHCASLTAHSIADDGQFATAAADIINGSSADSFTTVFLASSEENAALAQALLLKERTQVSDAFRVLVSAREDSALRQIVEQQTGADEIALRIWIKFLPPASSACGREAVYAESLDAVARSIHETWYRGNSAAIARAEREGDTTKARKLREKSAYKPWDKLTEEQKSDNRSAADHIAVKIRAAGLDPSDPELNRKWQSLDPATLDMLSRVEHERWCAVKWLGGWRLGERCDERKVHNNLVAFDELDEATKDFDLQQVKGAVANLDPRP